MKFRRNILPRCVPDVLCFLLIVISLPVVFLFEMVIVLPEFHQPGSLLYTFTFLLAVFIFCNIVTNMIACMLVDTSVDFESLKVPKDPDALGWRYCETCEKWAPQRSWHCKICRSCILKRDHHCLFTACCVGHRNHRFFTMFIVFLFIGSIYAFVYNSFFLWVLHSDTFYNFMSLFQIICPALYLVTVPVFDERNLYLILYGLNIFAVAYSVLLLVYHGQTILKGGVCYDRAKGYPYSLGWKQNLRCVLGKRMHLVWLSPFVTSELPDNGVTWNRNDVQNEKEK